MQRLRVAIYCRLSAEDRNKLNQNDDSYSIQNQKSMLVKYAMSQDWDIYKIYSDDDYAGSDRNRPEFNNLLRDAKSNKFDIVLCKTQSRFTRELELVEKYLHGLFIDWGIRFISLVDQADTDNKGNKKSRQINGLVNEWYLEDLSDNIKSVLKDKREKGLHTGGIVLYGYKKDPKIKGHIIIDEEAAAIVRTVFELYNSGMGKTAIARKLNEDNIPNPTEYKRLCGIAYKTPETRQSKLWKYYNISDMLKNEMYIGNMVQYRYHSPSYKSKNSKPTPKEQWVIVKGTHEPIIPIDLWNSVQTKLAVKSKPLVTGEIGLFAKKTRCRYCGYTLKQIKSRQYRYLTCSIKAVKNDACIGAFIPVRVLEQAVLDELSNINASFLDVEYINTSIQIRSDYDNHIEQLKSNIKKQTNLINEYKLGITEAYMDKVKGIINEDEYHIITNQLNQDRSKCEEIINTSYQKLNNLKLLMQTESNQRRIIMDYVNSDHLTRNMVEELIDYIVVGKKDEDGKYDVEIHWNF